MFVAFTLGLLGSFGHCLGMCSGVTLLLRRSGIAGRKLLLAHVGRVTTYALLGLATGAAGQALLRLLPPLRLLQGALGLAAGSAAAYMALALLGWLPSPETFGPALARAWGRAVRRLLRTGDSSVPVPAYFVGLAWGLLPCGLVLAALLGAAASATPLMGALTMLAFGLGTWPALFGMAWFARGGYRRAGVWARPLAASMMMVFGVQLALRGMAVWGLVQHIHLGSVMLW
ncbi:MAG: sulfite exporter TauE/SafE family protein [Anaerolineales bacterium]